MKWEVQSQHMNAASGGPKNKILKLKNVQLILKGFRREKKNSWRENFEYFLFCLFFVIFNSFSGFLKMHQKDKGQKLCTVCPVDCNQKLREVVS